MNRPFDLASTIDALLPQTQCRQCGYAGCRPYAEAIARGEAGIDQCPPGGDDGAREIAEVAGLPYAPVDRRFGATKTPAIARIHEGACIGCTLCIAACPVDAIVGAAKRMHTVITAACTGCELCIPPCPVDCITMHTIPALRTSDEKRQAALRARGRFERRALRLARARKSRQTRATGNERAVNVEIVEQAIARARKRLAGRGPAEN